MEMREYFATLLCVSAAAAVMQMLVKGSALKDHMAFLCSACVLAALVAPAAQLVSSMENADEMLDMMLGGVEAEQGDYEDIYREYLLDGGAQALEGWLSAELAQTLGKSGDDVEVEVTLREREGGAEVESVKVLLYPKAYDVRPEDIREAVYQRLFAECEIIYLKSH